MHGPPRAPRDRRYSTQAWRRVREQVRERDDHTCQACGRREPVGGRKTFPVDHRDPTGDFYDPANLWLLCWSCNTSKSGMSVDEWIARSKRQVGNGLATPYADRRPKAPVHDLVIRPRPTPTSTRGGRPQTSDGAFLAWAMALHGVSAEPGEHRHGRWDVCPTVDYAGAHFAVCPPSCSSPARWPLARAS